MFFMFDSEPVPCRLEVRTSLVLEVEREEMVIFVQCNRV